MSNSLHNLLTTRQVAELLGVKSVTVRNLVNAGLLPVIRFNRRCWRFRRETLEEWIKRKEKFI